MRPLGLYKEKEKHHRGAVTFVSHEGDLGRTRKKEIIHLCFLASGGAEEKMCTSSENHRTGANEAE